MKAANAHECCGNWGQNEAMARGRPVSDGLCLSPRHRAGAVVHRPRYSLSQGVCLNWMHFPSRVGVRMSPLYPKALAFGKWKYSSRVYCSSRAAVQCRPKGPTVQGDLFLVEQVRDQVPLALEQLVPRPCILGTGCILGLGRPFTMQTVNSVDFGDTHTGSYSMWPWATYLSSSFSLIPSPVDKNIICFSGLLWGLNEKFCFIHLLCV